MEARYLFRFNTKTPAAFFTPNPREINDFTGISEVQGYTVFL